MNPFSDGLQSKAAPRSGRAGAVRSTASRRRPTDAGRIVRPAPGGEPLGRVGGGVMDRGLYHDGNRRLQAQFDSRRIADRLEES